MNERSRLSRNKFLRCKCAKFERQRNLSTCKSPTRKRSWQQMTFDCDTIDRTPTTSIVNNVTSGPGGSSNSSTFLPPQVGATQASAAQGTANTSASSTTSSFSALPSVILSAATSYKRKKPPLLPCLHVGEVTFLAVAISAAQILLLLAS